MIEKVSKFDNSCQFWLIQAWLNWFETILFATTVRAMTRDESMAMLGCHGLHDA